MVWRKGTQGRLAQSLVTLFDQCDRAYPNRSDKSDGTIGDADHQNTDSDHNPWYGPGIVTAGDFTHDPAAGLDIDRITDELAAGRDPRIKYIIANGLILDSRPGNNPWRWVPYRGSNPHTKHLHLSVVADDRADDPRPWDLPSFRTQGDDMATPAEIWGHMLPDPYVAPDGRRAEPKAARVLLQWAATHAAYAKEQAVTARAEVAALRSAVTELAAHADLDVDALVAQMDAKFREALEQGLLDVEIVVRDKTDPEGAKA